MNSDEMYFIRNEETAKALNSLRTVLTGTNAGTDRLINNADITSNQKPRYQLDQDSSGIVSPLIIVQ